MQTMERAHERFSVAIGAIVHTAHQPYDGYCVDISQDGAGFLLPADLKPRLGATVTVRTTRGEDTVAGELEVRWRAGQRFGGHFLAEHTSAGLLNLAGYREAIDPDMPVTYLRAPCCFRQPRYRDRLVAEDAQSVRAPRFWLFSDDPQERGAILDLETLDESNVGFVARVLGCDQEVTKRARFGLACEIISPVGPHLVSYLADHLYPVADI